VIPTALPAAVHQVRVLAADLVLWGQDLVLVLVPQGGQARSRRNAWVAMAGEAALATAWRESEAAVREAVARAGTAEQPRLLPLAAAE